MLCIVSDEDYFKKISGMFFIKKATEHDMFDSGYVHIDNLNPGEELFYASHTVGKIGNRAYVRRARKKDLELFGYFHRDKIIEGLKKELKSLNGERFNIVDCFIEQIMKNIETK